MKNPILDAALSVAADHYKVTQKHMKETLTAGKGNKHESVILARGAYIYIANMYGIASGVSADYIGLNRGNATTNRQRFEKEMKPKEQLSLFDKVGKRIQLKTK